MLHRPHVYDRARVGHIVIATLYKQDGNALSGKR